MSSFKESVIGELLEGDDSVYAKLLTEIARGTYVSGDRLVTTALAERYGTSINPVREALKQLEGEGFVTFEKNRGARVTKFEYTTMRDVFEILQVLEPYLLEWFIQEHSAIQLAALDGFLDQMRVLDVSDIGAFKELDTVFHWEMYRHHYNKSAVALWKRKRLVLLALHADIAISKSRFESAIAEHENILQELRNGSLDSARTALTNHIVNGGDYWARLVLK